MARLVNATTSTNFLSVNTGTAIDYPITWAVRIKYHPSCPLCIPVTYGESYPAWDAEYSGGGLGSVNAVTSGQGSTFVGSAGVGPAVADQWHLFVGVWASATSRRVYWDSGSNTAVDTQPVPAHSHAQKNFTLGSFLLGPGSIHGGYGAWAHYADAALWNAALTPAEIDELAAGRPGDVQAANLKAWYKLGADGDLTSSVGSYPAMTVYGSCPVSPDPEYVGGPSYLPAVIHSPRIPRVLRPWENMSGPCRDRLLMSYPAIPPFNEAWGAGPWGLQIPSNAGLPQHGEDNSWRWLHTFGANSSTVNAIPPPAYGGYAIAFWIRVYTFTDYAAAGYYYAHNNVFTTHSFGGTYAQHVGYTLDPPGGFTVPRRFHVQQIHADGPAVLPYPIPTDEWIHAVIQVMSSYGSGAGLVKLWVNGESTGTATNGIDRDAYSPDTTGRVFGSHGFGQSSYGDYAAKDFREYSGNITDADANAIYRDSLEFFTATSSYVRNDIRPVRILEKLDYIPGEAGVYELAGYPAGGLATRKITGALGAYLLQGPPTLLRSTRILTPEAGPYAYGGQAVALQLVRLLQANPGGYALEGRAATLTLARGLLAEYGIYNLEGMQAELLYRVIHAGGGRIFYVMREDRTLRIIRDKDVEG